MVPGATVVLTSEGRGTKSAPVVWNATGDFVMPNTAANTCTIRSDDGRLPRCPPNRRCDQRRRSVTLRQLMLELGGANETVNVTSEAPLMQAQSGERSFTIGSAAVENLPIANRNFAGFT